VTLTEFGPEISNPEIRNCESDYNAVMQPVQSKISAFGFEMQDSSNFNSGFGQRHRNARQALRTNQRRPAGGGILRSNAI